MFLFIQGEGQEEGVLMSYSTKTSKLNYGGLFAMIHWQIKLLNIKVGSIKKIKSV